MSPFQRHCFVDKVAFSSLFICTIIYLLYYLFTAYSALYAESGAELLVNQLRSEGVVEEKENPNIFLVTASWQRLLSGAEDLGLFKEFSDGSMRSFTCINSHNFKEFHGNIKDK